MDRLPFICLLFEENIEKAIDTYYQIFIIFLLSPFIPYVRAEYKKYGFEYKDYPYITIIYGAQNAGKSTFIELMQKFMYDKVYSKIISSENFSYNKVKDYILANKGIALHFSELDKTKWSNNADKIIKMEESLIESNVNEHASIFITSNEIESDKIAGYFQKRIFYYELKLTMNRETASKMSKSVNEFVICTNTFIDILNEYNVEIPNFVKVLTLNEFRFKENTVEENEKSKVIRNLKHNIGMFTIVKKDNMVEYIPGEKAYAADKVAKLLPDLDATVSGLKVIMDIDIFERFFNGKFEYDFFWKN